jgi:cytochrome c peroxidase
MNKFIIVIFLLLSNLFGNDLIKPIPTSINIDYEKALLGKKLFNEVKLSSNNTISCASCHILDDGGDDNLRVSFGIDGKQGTRNSPTVYNSRYNAYQFWDASVKTLAQQALGPIHNPVEMGSNFNEIIPKLKDDKYYKLKFKTIYGEINKVNIIDAIVEFEKTLITPNSKFDRYLNGEKDILTKSEKDGYKYFVEYGCISCHNGINIGGNLIQKIGILNTYESDDLGRYNITKNDEDKYYFKVPSLRNINLTKPYFHDGKIESLKKAVTLMAKYQIGFDITEEELNSILAFLKTLTGEKYNWIEKQ